MVLEHCLRNTGKKPISTSVYEHNFYMLDHRPAGPSYIVLFPCEIHPQADLHGMAEARGKDFTYLKELQVSQSVATDWLTCNSFRYVKSLPRASAIPCRSACGWISQGKSTM